MVLEMTIDDISFDFNWLKSMGKACDIWSQASIFGRVPLQIDD